MNATTRLHAGKPPGSRQSGWQVVLGAWIIVLSGLVAYHNSFAGPFIFDDSGAIEDNDTIRSLWPIWRVLTPPANGETVTARPVVNLSLAINYAISGLDVWSYHVFNLAIHILAGLTLFGVIRRTLLLPKLRDRFAEASTSLSLAVALIWTVHPLQTQAVTYVVQRAESLMGLFYLLTLYCFIRAAPAGAMRWYVLAVLASLSGMASKEVMVTAPLMVLLYDRTFVAGSFAQALRRRWGLYAGLAATWGLLALLQLTMGCFEQVTGLTPWQFARTQLGVLLHYLRLCFWPDRLCLDYFGWPVANTAGRIVPGAVVIGGLLAATLWALVRRPAWGFLGAWFFMLLGPTSSVLPLADVAFEHRMYLSLAAVAAAVVVGAWMLWRRWAGQGHRRAAWRVVPVLLVAVVVALMARTVLRNRDYRSERMIWQAAVNCVPWNPRAHINLGDVFKDAGRLDVAIECYRRASRLAPKRERALDHLGCALVEKGQVEEGIDCFREALRVNPTDWVAHNNLGSMMLSQNKLEEAVYHYTEAIRLKGGLAETHHRLGLAYSGLGKLDEAAKQYREALGLKDDEAKTHNNLADILLQQGKLDEAIDHYRRVLAIEPNGPEGHLAHYKLGLALAKRGDYQKAVRHFVHIGRLRPDQLAPRADLADLVELARQGYNWTCAQWARRLDAQAAEDAAAGRLEEAIATATKAMEIAAAGEQSQLAGEIRDRLELYRSRRPSGRQPSSAPGR